MELEPVVPVEIAKAILVARNVNVVLDSDLARVYVSTMALIQAVKRNAARLPQEWTYHSL